MSIINLFRKYRKRIVRSKILIQRSLSYVAILNSAMILFLVLSKFQDYGLEIHITQWFIPIYAITFILLVLFGWLESKVGFHREEVEQNMHINPYTKEWMGRFDKIEAKIDDLEKKFSRTDIGDGPSR
ncbi:MAG: hypothetical protein ACLFPQ_05325 [Candidatus Woesearchaeota archaeon]